ncbi:biotin carboxylase, partial [Clostridium perfringens]
VRDFMDLLHTLHQHPEATFEELLGERAAVQPQGKGANDTNSDDLDDLLAEFEL